MSYKNFGVVVSKLSKSISLGMMRHGSGYRQFLLAAGLLIGGVVTLQHLGMKVRWLSCTSDISGPLLFLCRTQGWLFPMGLGLISSMLTILPWAAILGLRKFFSLSRIEKAFETIGLKNSVGQFPVPLDVQEKKDKSKSFTVSSNGIGIDRFKDRARDLESALGLAIDGIELGPNPSIVRISLCGSVLPRICNFEKLSGALTIPYSFLVGMSARETLTYPLAQLPHLIIAGTTGGGKSVYFKQVNLSLLLTSPRIQMYLFDLKGGVEMNIFSGLPNVRVCKNELDALTALEALNKEMDRRLKYLAQNGHSKVDFERDHLDMIVIGVDEASELYGKSSHKKEQKIVEKAREATDRLTKLARATGIHVILATQKVLKETIDTKIQENIGGRMIFRMNTLQGSMTVLGNKMAFELPDIPGRAIWSSGNRFTEVQAPYLSDEDLQKALVKIKEDFDEGERKNFAPMLTILSEVTGPAPDSTQVKLFKVDHASAD